MRQTQVLQAVLLMAVLLITSCGGGGGGGSSVTPPSGLSYTTPPAFVVSQAIAPLSPTVSGQVSSYSVDQALPAGLSLNTSSGVVSGTPTTATAQASYTVHAQNSAGSTSTTITLVVNPPPAGPAIKYISPKLGFTVGVPAIGQCNIYCLTPTVADASTQTWSIAPALPAGLTFSTTDGTIGGTPTAASPATSYVVTAQGSATVSTFNLTITVESQVVLDLGHTDGIDLIRYNSAHVLSHDVSGHWVLWDANTAGNIARGNSTCNSSACSLTASPSNGGPIVDLAGPTVMIVVPGGFELRSSTDGLLLSTITTTLSWWRLAADGSYLAGGNKTALMAWSPSGQVILSHAGDYSTARAFAAPGEIRVGNGPAAANQVETISLADGSSSLGLAFSGQFNTWFNDGERFLTNAGTTVWTYSKAGVQQDLASLPAADNLAGQGEWFWFVSPNVNSGFQIFKVGASATAALSAGISDPTKVIASGTALGLLGNSSITILDISGTTLASTTASETTGSFGAISSTQWLGSGAGYLFDGTRPAGMPKYFGYGNVLSVAGGSSWFALATASGRVLFFDTATGTQQGAIDYPAQSVVMSADGAVLGMSALASDNLSFMAQIVSLPDTGVLQSWTSNGPYGLTLSASGKLFGGVFGASSSSTGTAQVRDVVTGASVFSQTVAAGNASGIINISPDDTLIAVTSGSREPDGTSNVFRNGALLGAAPGIAAGWLDNNKLLTNTYTPDRLTVPQFAGAFVYDGTGIKLSASSIPELVPVQVATPDSIYSPSLNDVFSISTGAVTWTSGNYTRGTFYGALRPYTGAIAGSKVIFVVGTQVVAQTY